MIQYYLGEEPILQNAPTYLPFYEQDMTYVLEHFDDFYEFFKDNLQNAMDNFFV